VFYTLCTQTTFFFINNDNKGINMVYVFLANGFEDIECLATVDILRRGGIDVKTVSTTGGEFVTSAHNVTVKADTMIEDTDLSDADLLVMPGGMPGAANLNAHKTVRQALVAQAAKGGRIAAICAAPMVLGGLGLLKGRRATCYPGFEKFLDGATYTAELVTTDGNITTGRGPAATMPFAYSLLEAFVSKKATDEIRDGMIYTQLLKEA
jgi:protein deglycase